MESWEEQKLRVETAEFSTLYVLKFLGVVQDKISQRKAFEMFGEATVRRWLAKGFIAQISQLKSKNSKITYSQMELELLYMLEKKRANTNNIIELKDMIISNLEIASDKVLRRYGLVKDTISKSQAFEMFGPANVITWINLNLITVIKKGAGNSKIELSLAELKAISNLIKTKKIKI